MKVLKTIVIIIVVLIAIPLIVALFTAKDYKVEREIVINKPKQDVFNYIKFIKNQDHYSKWNMMDPNMQKDYVGTDGTVGFIYKWNSTNKNAGQGEQEIVSIKDGDRMDMDLRFKKPMDSKANSYMTTESVTPTQTKVKWAVYGHQAYPMNFVMVVLNMDKMLGGDIDTGLTNLKNLLEKQ